VNNCELKKSRLEVEHSRSKTLDWVQKMNRKEESIRSCSSNRRNSLVALTAVPGKIHL
jgi:hypothetical protein